MGIILAITVFPQFSFFLLKCEVDLLLYCCVIAKQPSKRFIIWWWPLSHSLSSPSMVKMVYSVYHGAIRTLRGLLLVVEMDSGKRSSPLWDQLLLDGKTLDINVSQIPLSIYFSYMFWSTVSSGQLMVKSSISTNILRLCLDVTGARTTSKISTHQSTLSLILKAPHAATGYFW